MFSVETVFPGKKVHLTNIWKKRSAAAAAAAVVLFSGCSLPAADTSVPGSGIPVQNAPIPPQDREANENYRRALQFIRTMEMLRKNYVDPEKVSYEQLFNYAMQGMVSALDPYSGYEVRNEHRQHQIKLSGKVVGIGAMAVKPAGKPVIVVRVIPRGPAATAGIKAGDQIIAIDNVPTSRLNLAGALEKLRGEAGTDVLLQIKRSQQTLSVKVRRAEVADPAVPPGSVKLISGKIGFFKLTSFNLTAPEGVREALQKLKKQGAGAIIIDLRYNPGGLVDSAVKIASLLLPPDKVIFRARSRNKSAESVVKTRQKMTVDTTTPIIILANAFSASCSRSSPEHCRIINEPQCWVSALSAKELS